MPLPAAERRLKPTRVRFGVLALISACVTINYLDRALLGIAAPSIRNELALSPVMMGFVLSAFSWTYFLGQVPSGIALDRFKTGLIYGISLLSWSVVTALHALTGGITSLLGLRFALGLAEAPCFPANNKVVTVWFPRRERARAIAVYTAAEYVGLSFLSPILFWILHHYGWRTLFAIAGMIGVTYAFYFARRYRDPSEHPAVNRSELDHIAAGGGVIGSIEKQPQFELRQIAELFRHRQMWGLCIGQFAVYSTFVFFLTWFPTYLATERQLGWIKVGVFTALPYIAGFFGILFAGWWSDWMLKRGISLNTARKLPVIAGLLGAATIMLANFVGSNVAVVCILSLAFFCQAMSSSGWAVLSEVSPKAQIGLIGGLFSASANLSGIVIPLVIGFLVQATGSFVSALVFVSAVAMVGALSWIFLIGDLKPMESASV